MKRTLLPLLLGASLTLAACGGTPSETPGNTSENPPVSTPADTNPSEPAQPDPPQQVAEPEPQPEPPMEPPIIWRQNGIGYPMVSDDPRAEGMKGAMLTFDDGPDPDITPRVLDTLKEHGIKAIFFITGYGAKNMDLVHRIHEEGHILAVHGQTHANMRELSEAEMRAEIEPLRELIKEVTGEYPKYYRPPFGAFNETVERLMDEYGLELMTWSLGSEDWVDVVDGYKDPQRVVQDVLGYLHPGANMLFHDTHKHTADALPDIIRELHDRDYVFVTLP